jgi:uncharacterized protein YllA (UPF0747 family)
VLRQVDALLGPGSHADELRAVAASNAITAKNMTWRTATRRFADALFGRFGVLVLDADDPALEAAVLRATCARNC